MDGFVSMCAYQSALRSPSQDETKRDSASFSRSGGGAFDFAFRVSKAYRRIEIVFTLVCDENAVAKVI
jgi:hypothetical protein